MFCPSCGKEMPEDSSFCPFCGTRRGSICPSCGNAIPADSEYCPFCGINVAAVKRKEKSEALKAKVAKPLKKSALIIGALFIAFFLTAQVVLPFINYRKAVNLLNHGQYKQGVAAFEALDGYLDSSEKIDSIKRNKDYFKYADIGSSIFFGNYEGKEMEWIILDKTTDSALLLSKYAVANREFNPRSKSITWGKSSVRMWLNGTFYAATFSDEEKALIIPKELSREDYPSIYYGDDYDKIFLLNLEEKGKYLVETKNSICYQAPDESNEADAGEVCWWWLRSTNSTGKAICVSTKGKTVYGGLYVESTDGGVRPAIWINLA